MIPLRFELKNFGAIKDADIYLRDITLAAITGHNGAGKSTTFTTAPLWALFGVTRSGNADDVINTGAQDCSVSFTFEHQGQIYRVIRTRSRAGRGKSGLELQQAVVGEGFRSLSGTTIKETQEKIGALLNLDADTFTASSMILQGRSNEFTAKAPGQRKAILAQILGLDIYDTLQEGAKKRAASIDKALSGNMERIRDGRERLGKNSGIGDEIATVEGDIASETQKAEAAEARNRDLEAKLSDALHAREELAAKEKLAEELRAREQTVTDGAKQLKTEIAEIDELLARESEYQKQVEIHERNKSLLAALKGKLARKKQLEADTQDLRIARITAEKEIGALEEKIAKGKEALARKPQLEAAAKEYADLQGLIEQDEETSRRVQSLRNDHKDGKLELEPLNSESLLLGAQINDCVEKVERLASSGCVDLKAAEIAPCEFLRDAIKAKGMLQPLQEKKDAIMAEVCRRLDELEEIDKRLYAIFDSGYSEEAAEARIKRSKDLKPFVDFLAGIEAKEELVHTLEEQLTGLQSRVDEAKTKLEPLSAELKQLSDELALVGEVERLIAETADAVECLKEIPALKERKKALVEKWEEAEKVIADLKAQRQALVEELLFADEDDSIDTLREGIAEAKATLASRKEQINALHAQLGALKKTRDEMYVLRKEIEKMEDERAPLAKDLTRWQTLGRAFSRNGIPALIIENAVPELERISNEILGQMSGGQHMLRFETQRELKSRDGVAETLDIIVSDWQGQRPYETFSGGEQLRIDLAIRFGLAELLANRAGSKVEWMVLDEGIGSQDAEHRAMVLEAIKNVSGRFRKVLVITHIEEAQGVFPQQIRLTRKDDIVEVMAV